MVFQIIRTALIELYDQFFDIIEHSDFSIPTWLAFGAALQVLSGLYLPSPLNLSIPLLWLAYRLVRSGWDTVGLFKWSFADIKKGRWTTRFPKGEGTENGVVVLLLGARLNHPFGKLGPGNAYLDVVFKDMWREAERNRSKWGYLGRTATLCDTSDSIGTTTIWITYWKDLKGLQAFAASPAHRLGQDGYEKGEYPSVGIMHETYFAPKGNSETIYYNFRRWGLGAANFVTKKSDGSITGDTLVPNDKGSTMLSRMRREN